MVKATLPAGFLNIDKPGGMTSHDVVAKVRRGLKIKKVGHAGTLDPMATGVLILCLGYATRLSEYAMHATKQYRATVHLGVETDTYDAEGETLKVYDASHVTREDVEAILPQFTGDIAQLPPMYSAIKQGGRKLYELARAGETVERKARPVTIHSLTIAEWKPPHFVLDVVCGAGTYIRSLAYDMGQILGVGAHLSGLVRVASGGFNLNDAVQLGALLKADGWEKSLLPPDMVLYDYPALHLDSEDTAHVLQGRSVEGEAPTTEFARAYDHEGKFIALLRAEGRLWRPHKVFFSG